MTSSPIGGSRRRASWNPHGALLNALGDLWGPSWAPRGALLGHVGAILRLQTPIGSEKREGIQHRFIWFGRQLVSWRGPWRTPRAHVTVLGPS